MKRVDVLKAAPLGLLAACSNPGSLFTAPSDLSPAGLMPDKGCGNIKPFWQWFPDWAQAAWYKPVQGKLGGCHFDCIGLVGLALNHKFPDMPPITIYFWARTGDCWTPKKGCGYGSITLESWNDERWSKGKLIKLWKHWFRGRSSGGTLYLPDGETIDCDFDRKAQTVTVTQHIVKPHLYVHDYAHIHYPESRGLPVPLPIHGEQSGIVPADCQDDQMALAAAVIEEVVAAATIEVTSFVGIALLVAAACAVNAAAGLVARDCHED
jgi:hypothetical protein